MTQLRSGTRDLDLLLEFFFEALISDFCNSVIHSKLSVRFSERLKCHGEDKEDIAIWTCSRSGEPYLSQICS